MRARDNHAGSPPGAPATADPLHERSSVAQVITRLRQVEDLVGASMLAGLVVVVLIQVFVRFLLSGRVFVPWTDELARFLMVAVTFWGAILVQRTTGHITIDFVWLKYPRWLQIASSLVANAIAAAFLIVVVTKAVPLFLDGLDRPLPASGFPAALFDAPVVIAGALLIVHIILESALQIFQLRSAPVGGASACDRDRDEREQV